MDLQEREFVAEIVRQAMLAGVRPNDVKDVLNRAFSARDEGVLGPTFMKELRENAPDFFAEAAQPPGATKKPMPAEAFRDSGGVIRLSREQALDVQIYRRARGEAEKTGKMLDIAE